MIIASSSSISGGAGTRSCPIWSQAESPTIRAIIASTDAKLVNLSDVHFKPHVFLNEKR